MVLPVPGHVKTANVQKMSRNAQVGTGTPTFLVGTCRFRRGTRRFWVGTSKFLVGNTWIPSRNVQVPGRNERVPCPDVSIRCLILRVPVRNAEPPRNVAEAAARLAGDAVEMGTARALAQHIRGGGSAPFGFSLPYRIDRRGRRSEHAKARVLSKIYCKVPA